MIDNYEAEIKILAKEVEAFKLEFQKKGQETLKKAFKSFFAANPFIKTLSWTQYTPYFNDGDECVFEVHDFYGSSEELNISEISDPYLMNSFQYGTEEYKNINKFRDILSNNLSDIFKEVFGDHVYVVASKDKFETEEYEHD